MQEGDKADCNEKTASTVLSLALIGRRLGRLEHLELIHRPVLERAIGEWSADDEGDLPVSRFNLSNLHRVYKPIRNFDLGRCAMAKLGCPCANYSGFFEPRYPRESI